jgi:hypothetical protein
MHHLKGTRVSKELLDRVYHTFHCDEMLPEDFRIPEEAGAGEEYFRVIQLVEGEITTREISVPVKDGKAEINVKNDILKLAVIERHHGTKHIGLGFIHGYGLGRGAIAILSFHDSTIFISSRLRMTWILPLQPIASEICREAGQFALDGKIIGGITVVHSRLNQQSGCSYFVRADQEV